MQLTNEAGDLTWGSLIEAVQNIEDTTSMSLFQYTKRAVINSRVFIERSLANEEILTPLMLNTMNLYTGLIMTATSMNSMVTDSRRVRDMMSVVSTESFRENMPEYQYSEDVISNFFGAPEMSQSTWSKFPHRSGSGTRQYPSAPSKPASNPNSNPNGGKGKGKGGKSKGGSSSGGSSGGGYSGGGSSTKIGGLIDDEGVGNMSGSDVLDIEPRDANLPSGRVIQVKFGTARSEQAFTVNLYLQLSPQFIPVDVAEQFIGLNFSPSFKQRWMQASAGEISFIKDLIMGQDMRKRRRKAMKNDKTGALREMIERQENALSNSWMKLIFLTPERQNIANTILILEKSNFEKACSRAGLRFKDFNSRQKFFNKTFAMMLHVVDPMFNKVTSYYHGLNAISEFTFDQIKRNSRNENVDLMQVMKAYAQGMAPKF